MDTPGAGSGRRPSLSAHERALGLLARRAHSTRELSDKLARRGHAAPEIDDAVARLTREGLLDDLRYAVEFASVRIERRGHGRVRVLADLSRNGVARDVAERAWATALGESGARDEALLERSLSRQLKGRTSLDRREARRVYNALLRAGFDDASIRRAVQPLLAEVDAGPRDRGIPDELA